MVKVVFEPLITLVGETLLAIGGKTVVTENATGFMDRSGLIYTMCCLTVLMVKAQLPCVSLAISMGNRLPSTSQNCISLRKKLLPEIVIVVELNAGNTVGLTVLTSIPKDLTWTGTVEDTT